MHCQVEWRRQHGARIFLAVHCLAAAVLLSIRADAQEDTSAGHGHIALTWQYIHVDGLESTIGLIPIGTVETHTFFLEGEYNLTDRLTIIAGLPYVRKRYDGSLEHDPLLLDPPRPDIENVDQGDWNDGLQDIHLGARYRWIDGQYQVSPFVMLNTPSNSYPFFGHAAVGQNLNKLEVGADLGWFPGLSNAYYRLGISHVFVEETLGVSINHWRVVAEYGYRFTDRMTANLFSELKVGKGLDFPDDFPVPRTDEQWYQHDRLVRHNYWNVGAGLTWALSHRYIVNSSIMTQTWGETVHRMDYGASVTFGWSF